MKILSSVIVLGVSLCASLCCSEPEDNFPETLNIENNSIISIENNQTEFPLNSTIYINTIIENQQTLVNGNTIVLSNFDYGEINQSHYNSALSLYKITDFGTIVKIPLLPENIEILEGDIILNNDEGSQDISFLSYYNGMQYKSKIGIQLQEAGNYFIASSQLHNNDKYCYLNGGDFNINYIQIKSKIIESNLEGKYLFTVTP